MPKNERLSLSASAKQDSSTDSMLLQANEAQCITNLLTSRDGHLRGNLRPLQVVPDLPYPSVRAQLNLSAQGIGYYYGPENYLDRALVLYSIPDLIRTANYQPPPWNLLGAAMYEAGWYGLTAELFASTTPGQPQALAGFTPPYPTSFVGGEVDDIALPPNPVTIPMNMLPAGTTYLFAAGVPYRSEMFGEELIIAANNGLVPTPLADQSLPGMPEDLGCLRYVPGVSTATDMYAVGSLYPLGLQSPLEGSITLSFGGAASPGLGIGNYGYAVSYVDEKGRESDLSSPVFEETGGSGWNGSVVVTLNSTVYAKLMQPYIGAINLYRTTLGDSSDYYLINTWTTLSGNNAYTDSTPDDLLVGLTLGPKPGENAVCNPANLITVYLNRVVLNDMTNPNQIQISGFGNAVQYSLIPYFATDGIVIQLDEDQSNAITGFASLGNYLLILRRKNIFYLTGNSAGSAVNNIPPNFAVYPLPVPGNIAIDSVATTRNFVYFLAGNGLYRIDGLFNVVKISRELDLDLQLYFQGGEAYNALTGAVAWYENNRYHIHIDLTTYVFDFESSGGQGGWSTWRLGEAPYGTNLMLGVKPGVTLQTQN